MTNFRTRYTIAIVIVAVFTFSAFYWKTNKKDLFYYTMSEYGPIWVYDNKGLRCMSFIKPPSNKLQSCMYIKDGKSLLFNYVQLFLSTLFIQHDPKKILIIGLGGGSLQKSLNTLLPDSKIHTVEINQAILPLAEKYFFYYSNETNKIIVDDAVKYVKNSAPNRYDLVFIDAFDVKYIPDELLTLSFMSNIKRILTKRGVVAINTFMSSTKTELESKVFGDIFGPYYILKKGNARVLVTRPHKKLPSYAKIANNSEIWSYRMSELGINQSGLLSLYKNTLFDPTVHK